MKNFFQFGAIILVIFLGSVDILVAQKSTTVNQVIICNGGKFENPNDYVTIESYNPVTGVVTVFDTIYTQSVQDILIVDHFAYVAAQDSIVKYDIDTYQRLAAVADSGMAKLGFFSSTLIVTKQYPVVRFRVEALNSTNLALLGSVENISGDCGGVVVDKDSVFVAVNGGYLGTEGKVAVINPANWTLSREINFGPSAVGIWNLYTYNGYLYSVNRTPFGGEAGSITKYNLDNGYYSTKVDSVIYGDGIAINGTLLYLGMNNGIGSYNLNTDLIADTVVVHDPGSGNHINILAAALDFINNQFYLNIGNRSTFGVGIITDMNGDSLTSFSEGLSADCLSIDYRTPVGINPLTVKEPVSVYPNPVNDKLNLVCNEKESIHKIVILDLTGRTIYSKEFSGNEKSASISCGGMSSGVYFLSLETEGGSYTKKFIKR
jgi:hypothetical protein